MRHFIPADKSEALRAMRVHCARPNAFIVRRAIAGGIL
jgi:hypothetical protein